MYAGVDSHKDTLAVAVIDGAGRAVARRQLRNDAAGFAELAALVIDHDCIRVGIEGSTNFGWPAAMHLVEAGKTVVEVPPLMTSRAPDGGADPDDAGAGASSPEVQEVCR